ncbi:MAG: glutathione peroxidase [Solirubrobacterales bacterium]|nr:glutathione peroxidase [Solirubrobacterales bacterium]
MENQDSPVVLAGSMELLDGTEKDLGEYLGGVTLVVNTASKCGLTPQFEGLQKIYSENHDRGFTVLGFPANDFMEQEPGTGEEIAEFCQKNYGVEFPMFAKTSVVGDEANPLFAELADQSEQPEWNFAKYLIDREGRFIRKFPAPTDPADDEVIAAIDSALG